VTFIDGTPVGATVGRVLANSVARGVHPEAALANDISLRLLKAKQEITLDKIEFDIVQHCVQQDQQTANFAKARMLAALEGATNGK
jgi:hypothetical protein